MTSEGEPPRQDAIFGVATVAAKADVPSVTVSLSTMIWPVWIEHALRSEAECGQARRDLEQAKDAGDGDAQGRAMGAELAGGLLAICCAGFAVESLAIEWTAKAVPAETAERWRVNRPKAENRVREVLKGVCSAPIANGLADRWTGVIRKRSGAVHYLETVGPGVQSEAGIGLVAQPHVTYSVESASAAVDLLFETLNAVISANAPALAHWIATNAARAAELEAGRSAC